VTVSDFGELAAFATTRSVVPPILKSVVYTPGDVCVMLLVMPPAEVTDAASPVALNV
jgi:hypothetical protein